MNKSKAMIEAKSNARSIGELRALIAAKRGGSGISKVNPQFTLEEALNIFDAAIKDRPGEEIPAGMRYDPYLNKDVPSRDALIIKNILWECAP